MARHGSLAPFDSSKESWSNYVERLGFYFVANDVDGDEKKRSILLSVCGHQTFKLIRSLVDAVALQTKSYDDLVQLVKDYYDAKPSRIVQRFKFNSRARATDESVATYVAALRQIAEHCDYKDSLQDMLRDCLVCGVNHPVFQRRLLAEKDLTYEAALDLAKSLEAAEKGSHALTIDNKSEPVHLISQHQHQKNPMSDCYRCGGRGHIASICRFKDQECHKCKKRTYSKSLSVKATIKDIKCAYRHGI